MELGDRNATTIFDQLAQQNRTVGESLMTRSFQAGETVCEGDDMVGSLFLVASGRVQLYRATRDGRRFVIATLGPGSMFGEASLLGGQGPDTRAVALESGTVWVMPA
jgi:CRP/FNR family transcriptional regulator